MAEKYDKKNRALLDVGAGSALYKKYFNLAKYYAQDLRQNENNTIDYVGDIDQGLSMIKENTFDYLLCIQVLEHLKNPLKAFREFYRILKPGGKIFLTTNFFYQIHMAPNDYYRFTKSGLIGLGEKNGFIIKHLEAHGGIFHVLTYIITTLPIRLFFKKNILFYHLYLIFFAPLIILLNVSAYILDFTDKDKEITINYEVIYKKND